MSEKFTSLKEGKPIQQSKKVARCVSYGLPHTIVHHINKGLHQRWTGYDKKKCFKLMLLTNVS